MLDESEVLTPADPFYHINKKMYKVPVVCGARTFPEAVRRIFEGDFCLFGIGNIHNNTSLCHFSKSAF